MRLIVLLFVFCSIYGAEVDTRPLQSFDYYYQRVNGTKRLNGHCDPRAFVITKSSSDGTSYDGISGDMPVRVWNDFLNMVKLGNPEKRNLSQDGFVLYFDIKFDSFGYYRRYLGADEVIPFLDLVGEMEKIAIPINGK